MGDVETVEEAEARLNREFIHVDTHREALAEKDAEIERLRDRLEANVAARAAIELTIPSKYTSAEQPGPLCGIRNMVAEIEAWKEATGLDPDGVRPEDLSAYLARLRGLLREARESIAHSYDLMWGYGLKATADAQEAEIARIDAELGEG